MREERAAGSTYPELRERYNISHAALYKILHGKSYRDWGGPIQSGGRGPAPILKPLDVTKIQKLFATGNYTMRQLADRYRVSVPTIHKAVHN